MPPVIVMMPMQENQHDSELGRIDQSWPILNPNDWCGQHEPKEDGDGV